MAFSLLTLESDHFLTGKGFDRSKPSESFCLRHALAIYSQHIGVRCKQLLVKTQLVLQAKFPGTLCFSSKAQLCTDTAETAPNWACPPSDQCFGAVHMCVLMLLSCFSQTVQLLYFALSKRHDSGNSLPFSSSE